MAQSGKSELAIPVLYGLLAAVAVMVQWNKWEALHRSRNLVALLMSLAALLVAGTYLLRGLRAKRQAKP